MMDRPGTKRKRFNIWKVSLQLVVVLFVDLFARCVLVGLRLGNHLLRRTTHPGTSKWKSPMIWKTLLEFIVSAVARFAALIAHCYFIGYEISREMICLESAIALNRSALSLRPPVHPDCCSSLFNLANGLSDRYGVLGKMEDLEESITLHREALEFRPAGHPDHPKSLNNLAGALSTRYRVLGKMEDLEESITLHREALEFRPAGHPDHPSSLNNLAVVVSDRYDVLGKIEDLEESITLHREALEFRPAGHPDRPESLNKLAVVVSDRYDVLGKIEDLEESITLHREALEFRPTGHPDRPKSLNNLAVALSTRYGVLGKMEDLEESITLHCEALEFRPAGHPRRSSSLNNLAIAVSDRYDVLGKIEDLEESITLHREGLEFHPAGHPDRPSSLNNLASALSTRYRVLGKMEDLEESITLHREALEFRPAGRPRRPSSLNNLASALSTRYRVLGKMEDLEESITLHREALEFHPAGHPDRPSSLNNLAIAVSDRYDVLGKIEDLEESITLQREALEFRPTGHPDRPESLNNLAVVVSDRYDVLGKMEDLEESITLHREALEFRPAGHPNHPLSLNNLAGALSDRYGVLGKMEDLEKCIILHREALEFRPAGNFYHSQSLTYLASALQKRLQFRQVEDLQEVFSLYEQAAHDAISSVQHRLRAATQWADAGRQFQHHSLLSAYKISLDLISRCMLSRSSVESQQKFLASAQIPKSLASDAASTAIAASNLELAVEFLEQGRSILWSKVDAYKQPLHQLRQVEGGGALADRLESLGAELEQIILSSSDSAAALKKTSVASVEAQMKRHRILSEEWEDLVTRIREIDGFSYFLQAPPFNTLQCAANKGPVILVIISRFRSDAVILLKDSSPVLVNLPEVKLTSLRAQKLGSAREITTTMRYLWDTIASPVVDRLTEMGVPKKGRIWWCPTAELCALPLHAAGRGKQNLQDIYTSSYISTLSSLIRARSNVAQLSTVPKLLVVGQPSETLKLEQVEVEVDFVKKLCPSDSVDVLFGPEANCEAVLDSLKRHSWVHFACHGHLGKDSQPFRASFELHDGVQTRHLPLLDIIQTRLPNAEFAFLSACHSAAGDSHTPDESIHLSAALQFCGFRSVVGTLWEMDDEDGPTISEAFYKYMFRNPDKIDFRDSAHALNHAIAAMRKAKLPSDRWVMFVHIGA